MTHESIPLKEFRRKEKVVDMLITGHALLRDRYQRRAFVLRILILGLSAIATAVAFVNGPSLSFHGINLSFGLIAGALTSAIFLITLIELLTRWSEQAGLHGESVRKLAEVKNLFRGVSTETDPVNAPAGLTSEYERVMPLVAPIPERDFLRVKVKHSRKVEVSRLIDNHPGAPLWALRILAMWNGLLGVQGSRAK
jgi:hypothetical protein